jgi:hypothetical protein
VANSPDGAPIAGTRRECRPGAEARRRRSGPAQRDAKIEAGNKSVAGKDSTSVAGKPMNLRRSRDWSEGR